MRYLKLIWLMSTRPYIADRRDPHMKAILRMSVIGILWLLAIVFYTVHGP